MAGLARQVYDLIWSESLWFPEGHTWAELENPPPGVYYPQFSHVALPAIVLGIAMLCFRFLCERLIFRPIGLHFGLQPKEKSRKSFVRNAVLESAFKRKRFADTQTTLELSKKTNLTERQVQRWFRQRRNYDTPGKMKKFCEVSWHFTFYSSILVYGAMIIRNKPWYHETKYAYIGWPQQHVETELYWYYMFEMGFYWSLLLSLLSDIKRKDFVEMTAHHFVTLMLTTMSWSMNFVRTGSLILFVHDLADMWMAGAKMAKYCKKQTLCEILFGIFIVIWLVTRLFVFPYWCLWSAIIEIQYYIKPFALHNIFIFLLVTLQILHVLWSYMILRIAFQKFSHGELKSDVRSASEGETEESEEENCNEKMTNGEISNNNSQKLPVQDNNLQNRTKRKA